MNREELRKERLFEYDTSKYNFKEGIEDILLGSDYDHDDVSLGRLHTLTDGSGTHVLTFAADQNLPWHRKYYDSDKLPALLELYRDFVKNVVAPVFTDEDEVVVQCKPTFRVHLPNNTAVPSDVGGDPERPGLHCDADYNHPTNEINFWLPVTDTNPKNTMWLETAPHKGDFRPAIVKHGQVLQFWGAQCRHYNTFNRIDDDEPEQQQQDDEKKDESTNTTTPPPPPPSTRVSFDFRVMNKSDWDAMPTEWFTEHAATVQAKMKLRIGSYYMVLNKRTGEFRMKE